LVIVLGLGKIHARFLGHYDFSGSMRFAWALAYAALLMGAAYGLGLPDAVRGRGAMVAGVDATVAAALSFSFLQFVGGSALLPRFVVLLAPPLLVPWYLACSRIAAGGQQREAARSRVVAVLTPEEAAALRRDLAGRPDQAACLAAVLAPGPGESTAEGDGLLVAAAQSSAAVIVLDRAAEANESVVRQAAQLHSRGVRIRTLGRFYDEWIGKVPDEELAAASLMFDIGELHSQGYQRVKRAIDVVIGAVGTVILGLVMPVVALANRTGNHGPLLYRQARVGKNGVEFDILKFRTMRADAPDEQWTAQGDSRVTPVGRWMRRVHLDELPQVVNILRGDLSTVGPRPERPHHVEQLDRKIPFYHVRHLVRPGLTGWAQVSYHYGSSDLDAHEKLLYEVYYLRHQSFSLDVRIIVRTLRSVVTATGR
jgi:lipopolysaccharide/colanic/teichoic acid biosynthesis glycosyltransferase